MKLEDGYYVDENDNRWNSKRYSEGQAVEYSKALINCNNCTNCRDCRDCRDCIECVRCTNCISCTGCTYCTHCKDCVYCAHCRNCIGCTDCRDCFRCQNFTTNPRRYTGPKMETRNTQPTTYWEDGKIQVCCEGFIGTLEEFEKAILKTYSGKSDQKYFNNYVNYINIVKMIIRMEKENSC